MNTSKKKSTSGNRNAWIVGGVIAAVIAIAAVVAISSSSSKDSTVAGSLQEFSEVTVSGDVLPAFDEAAKPDPAVGMLAPVLSGKGFTGNVVTTEPTGTPTLLVFLAHWCPHCQREVPLLVEWEKSGTMPNGIDVFGVATGTDSANPNYPPSEWLARENFPATWPVMADSADKVGGNAFGLAGYPYFVLVGGDGKVLVRMSGEIPMDELTATILALTGA
ncbi:MAG: TlpA family protein disulfide reductase [Actinobacteria bacterium]|nr:MAG: TlpA family protein disulfide reductase [Actinomycetota bacterium]